MEIILAKSAGFCFGVKRAVECVYNEVEKGNPQEQHMGPLGTGGAPAFYS